MQWKSNSGTRIGARRTVSKFLWFPLDLNGKVKWLEKATWTEVFVYGVNVPFWNPESWVE